MESKWSTALTITLHRITQAMVTTMPPIATTPMAGPVTETMLMIIAMIAIASIAAVVTAITVTAITVTTIMPMLSRGIGVSGSPLR